VDNNPYDMGNYDFSSRSRTAHIGETVIWVNHYGKILISRIDKIEYENNQKHWQSISYKIMND
jgi:hypothetical protein